MIIHHFNDLFYSYPILIALITNLIHLIIQKLNYFSYLFHIHFIKHYFFFTNSYYFHHIGYIYYYQS